jgi:imidazolonepropionase-like amidohydrolase
MIIINNARIFNGEKEVEENSVIIENNIIKEVGSNFTSSNNSNIIDAKGNFLMPGLIDAHFHANTPSYDFYASDRMPAALIAAHAAQILTGVLKRGYTTIRDAGGGDIGLKLALDAKLIDGPRFFYPGKAITQTGGHGDMRRKDFFEPCGCAYSGNITQVVDGSIAMRKAIREEFRKGANQIKIFLSGGVSTNLAPLEMPHFSDEEISAAVDEANRRNSYVMAHCHTDEGANRCVDLGVRSIEHGSLIKENTAKRIKENNVYVVPTLSAGELIADRAKELGLEDDTLKKVKEVNSYRDKAIEYCSKAGVKMGLGCDLHGHENLKTQGRELWLRGQIQKPIEVLRSATTINAEIIQMKNRLGAIKEDAFADLLIIKGDPLKDLSIFIHSEENILLLIKDGEIKNSRLN